MVYAVLVVGAASSSRTRPRATSPRAGSRTTTERADKSGRDFEFGQAVRTWQWFALWALLFLNVTAGIAVISEAAPMAEEIGGASATAAASLVS